MDTSRDATVRLLRRKEAARYLTDMRGLPIAPQTLAKLAVVWRRPLFRKFGRFPALQHRRPRQLGEFQAGAPAALHLRHWGGEPWLRKSTRM